MATYTNNYAWTKPSGSDQVDVSVLNDNLDSQDRIMHDAFLNMAEPFSELSTYSVGDIVLYGTKTYKCRVAVTTAGAWTGATNWDEYKLSEGGSSTGGEVKNLDNGMLSHSTDSSYITVNLDVALTAGKEYKITLRDPAYNYVDTKQITWTATTDVIFEGNGGGQYKIQLTQTTASLYNYGGQGWRDIYCDIISDFETVTAAQTTYDNTDSGLSATDVQGAVDELAEADNTSISATYFNSNLIFSRVGKVGFFNYNGDISNMPTGSLGIIGSIPEGYRPVNSLRVMSMSKDKYVQLALSPNGEISGYNYDSAYSSATICRYAIVAYPLA